MIVEKSNMLVMAMLTTLAVSSAVLQNGTENTTETLESREEMMIRYRLPNNTVPRLYRINIEPNMLDPVFTWTGQSNISLQVFKDTKILTLHAYKNLVIDENFTELVCDNGRKDKYKPIKHRRDEEVEFLMIEFEQDISVGNYTLNLKYKGNKDTEIYAGFYRVSQTSEEIPIIAATLFEPTMARQAFPCWDEPALKAQFSVSINHYPNFTVISNMPIIESVETWNGKNLTTFETTPIMSTYLVSFVIADNYESTTNEYGNMTVWMRKNLTANFQYVSGISQKVLDFMESYTGLPFGLSRIGSVMIPWYGAAGMEHWGLVSYSEKKIVLDRSLDKIAKLDWSDTVIAHELSHSWFGCRVTPLWWNDIWLNEGFATYFHFYIIDQIYDNRDNLGLFIVENNQEKSFPSDMDNDNVPLRWAAVTNTEILQMFKDVTYAKGAAIVHMFRNVLTDDVFQAGIRKFLRKYSFIAADTEDLMESFQEALDEYWTDEALLNVHDAMMTWLTQTGYPMINVTRDYTTGNTKVTQRSVLIGDSRSKKWWIPLNYATKTNPNFASTAPSSWISHEKDDVTIGEINRDDWVIFNVQASGYYRVNYDEENWKRLIEYLNTDNYNNIHVLNRAQLINDALFLAQREPSRYDSNFWQLMTYLSREVEYLPWRVAKKAMFEIYGSPEGSEFYETFKKYLLGLMNNFIEKVGYEIHDEDDHLTKLAKRDITGWACLSGHSGCAEFSVQKILRLMENPVTERIHPDNKDSIICGGLRALNDTNYALVVDWLFSNYKSYLYRSLGCTENHVVHEIVFNRTIQNPSYNFYVVWLTLLRSSEENFNYAVDYVMENIVGVKEISQTYRLGGMSVIFVDKIIQTIKSNSRLEKFKNMFDLNPFADHENSSEFLRDVPEIVAKTNEMTEKFRRSWAHSCRLRKKNTKLL